MKKEKDVAKIRMVKTHFSLERIDFLLFLQTTTKVQQNVEFDCSVLKMVVQRKGTLLTF
jgi:hypothetical protein